MTALTAQLIEELAAADPDRMLAAGFAAPEIRARLIALIGFNHELARAREAVREPGLGAIRLQWWREAVEACCGPGPVRRHPVVLALAGAVREADLPRALLDAMIDAREAEFEDAPFANVAQLEDWLDAGPGNLVRLSLLACGLPAIDAGADRLARETGIGWGLAGLMRALPWWSARGACWIPADRLAAAGLERGQLAAEPPPPALPAALAPLVHRVAAARATVRPLARALPAECVAAYIYLALAPGQARRAARGVAGPDLLLLRQLKLVGAAAVRRP